MSVKIVNKLHFSIFHFSTFHFPISMFYISNFYFQVSSFHFQVSNFHVVHVNFSISSLQFPCISNFELYVFFFGSLSHDICCIQFQPLQQCFNDCLSFFHFIFLIYFFEFRIWQVLDSSSVIWIILLSFWQWFLQSLRPQRRSK